MGTDTPLAVLSDRPRILFDYFQQLFAQVTNPPLDAIREELVTSLSATMGPEGNLLEPGPESCRQIELPFPIIDNDDLARLIHVDDDGTYPAPRGARRLRACIRVADGGDGLRAALERVCLEASRRHRRRQAHPGPVGSQLGRRMGADSFAAADLGRAPPPDPPEDAHARRAGRGRRATRAKCTTWRC